MSSCILCVNRDMEEFVKANIDKLFESLEMPELPPIAQYVQQATDEALSVLDWPLDRQVSWRQQFKRDGSANTNIIREIVAGKIININRKHSETTASPLPKSEQEKVVQAVLATPSLTAEWNKTLETLIEWEHPCHGRSKLQAKSLEKRFDREFSRADVDGNGTVDVTELAAVLRSVFGFDGSVSHSQRVISYIDMDGNGVVSRDEYIAHRFRAKNLEDREKANAERAKADARRANIERFEHAREDMAEGIVKNFRGDAERNTKWIRDALRDGMKKKEMSMHRICENLSVSQPTQSCSYRVTNFGI